MKDLWLTGYVVFGSLSLVLAYLEWQVPGFVSYVFPFYLACLVVVVCGLGTLLTNHHQQTPTRPMTAMFMMAGLVLCGLVLESASVFGAFRLVVALITLVLPVCLLKALADAKHD